MVFAQILDLTEDDVRDAAADGFEDEGANPDGAEYLADEPAE